MFAGHLADAFDVSGRQFRGEFRRVLAAARLGREETEFRREDRPFFQVAHQERKTARSGPNRDPGVARMAIGIRRHVPDELVRRPNIEQRHGDAATATAAGLRFPGIPALDRRARIAGQRRGFTGETEEPLHSAIVVGLLHSRLESPLDLRVHPLPDFRTVGQDLWNAALRFLRSLHKYRDHVHAVPVAPINPDRTVRGDFGLNGHLLIRLPTEPAVP